MIKRMILKWLGIDLKTQQEELQKLACAYAHECAIDALSELLADMPTRKRREYANHFARRFRRNIEDTCVMIVNKRLDASFNTEQFMDSLIARINRKQVRVGIPEIAVD